MTEINENKLKTNLENAVFSTVQNDDKIANKQVISISSVYFKSWELQPKNEADYFSGEFTVEAKIGIQFNTPLTPGKTSPTTSFIAASVFKFTGEYDKSIEDFKVKIISGIDSLKHSNF